MEYKECKVCKGEVEVINEKYNLGQCNDCKLIFCLTIFEQDEFVKTYDELYNNTNAIYSSHSTVEYNMLLENKKIKVGYNRSRLLKKHVFNGQCKSVLEIGSGIGLIGCYLREKDETIKYLGVEIDKKSFEKSQFLKLNTINGDFTDIDKIEETFDLIMLWEVIEHLQDLNLFLELAYKKLNKNGKIILSTPNYNKIYNYPEREKDAIYQNIPPIHINFFTKENIVNVFKSHRFDNCNAVLKKNPYVDFKNKKFYLNILKSFFNSYNGPTIYFEATKK